MTSFSQELRFALRALLKRPGYAIVVVAILALGIGSTTAIFTLVEGVLLNPLPHSDPDGLVAIWEVDARSEPINRHNLVSPANFADWREHNEVFEHISAFGLSEMTSLEGERPERILAGLVTEGFFKLLRAEPQLGRVLLDEENQPGHNRVVVLSHGFWQRAYGGDPKVIGRSLHFASGSAEVVGVMPAGFDLLDNDVQLWTPRALTSRDFANRRSHFLQVIARLRPDISVAEAKLHMEMVAAGIREEHAEWMTGWGVSVRPLSEELIGSIRPALLTLLAAAAMVLLVACVNLANLGLARSEARSRELAVRAALGAGRSHLVRSTLSESILLSLAGGALGVGVSILALRTLLALAPQDLPRLSQVSIDAPVLGFTLTISLLTGVLFGVGPAIWGTRSDLRHALTSGVTRSTRSQHRLRRGLVTAEVALSFVLLTASWLLGATMLNLLNEQPGFDDTNVLTWRVSLPTTRYRQMREQNTFYNRTIEQLERLPGVEAVGVTRYLPLDGAQSTWDFLVEGRPSHDPLERIEVALQPVSPDYFSAMGVQIVSGRGFNGHDNGAGRPVILINEAMARHFFPGESPLGRRGRIFDPQNPLREIVGVVADVKHGGLDGKAEPTMYPPQDQMQIRMGSEMVFALRARTNPLALADAVRRVFREADAEIPVSRVRMMDEVVSRWLAARKFVTTLVAFFAATALILTLVGIYGVIAYSVTRRHREIGLRAALGARPGAIRRLIVLQGVHLVAIGIALGAVVTSFGSGLLSSLLYGVEATDPRAYAAVALVLAAVAILASYLPAIRASRIDPVRALRDE